MARHEKIRPFDLMGAVRTSKPACYRNAWPPDREDKVALVTRDRDCPSFFQWVRWWTAEQHLQARRAESSEKNHREWEERLTAQREMFDKAVSQLEAMDRPLPVDAPSLAQAADGCHWSSCDAKNKSLSLMDRPRSLDCRKRVSRSLSSPTGVSDVRPPHPTEGRHGRDRRPRHYLTAIEVERKTARTIASYTNSLADFRRVGRRAGLREAIEEYEVQHVCSSFGDLRRRGAAPGYQNRRHREVRTFFAGCRRMGLVEENVFARVSYAALEEKIYPPLSHDVARRLLDTQDRSRLKGCRGYAMILFLLDTGVRVAECLAMRLEDVDWGQTRARARHGTGRKQRYVGIGEPTAEALRDYITRFRGERGGPLFLNRQGHAFADENAIRVMLWRVGQRAGVMNVHPHQWTAARRAARGGADRYAGRGAGADRGLVDRGQDQAPARQSGLRRSGYLRRALEAEQPAGLS